jgi:hypothetical protein
MTSAAGAKPRERQTKAAHRVAALALVALWCSRGLAPPAPRRSRSR